MPMPRFDFADHEWLPPYGERVGVASTTFDVMWDGEKVEVAARWIKTSVAVMLFFRRLSQDQTIWLVGSGQYTPGYFGFMVGRTSPEHTASVAQSRVEDAIRSSCFGRALNFDTSIYGIPETEWLYLNVDGQSGCWKNATSSRVGIFRLHGNSFRQHMASPDSDIRFALQWSHLAEDERISKVIRFQNGRLRELEVIVRALGISEAARQNISGSWNMGFTSSLRFGTDALSALRFTGNNARLRRWSHHLNRYFAPLKDSSLAKRYTCVRRFHVAHYAYHNGSAISSHERLEAALFLRDWARGKIPPNELRLLLPKL